MLIFWICRRTHEAAEKLMHLGLLFFMDHFRTLGAHAHDCEATSMSEQPYT